METTIVSARITARITAPITTIGSFPGGVQPCFTGVVVQITLAITIAGQKGETITAVSGTQIIIVQITISIAAAGQEGETITAVSGTQIIIVQITAVVGIQIALSLEATDPRIPSAPFSITGRGFAIPSGGAFHHQPQDCTTRDRPGTA
jgi:hypothetical protein